MMQASYTVFSTPMGWMGIAGEAGLIRGTTLPQPTPDEAVRALGNRAREANWDIHPFLDSIKRLSAYFAGEAVDFPERLDPNAGTDFQRAVWEAARKIPYGQTRTYRDIALQVGRPLAARAVGQALGANPFPIIVPCHRVLGSNGGLGGFGGGLRMKQALLELEKPADV